MPHPLPRFVDVTPAATADALAGPGVELDLGAMRVRVRTSLSSLAGALHSVYAQFPFAAAEGFFDVDVEVARSPGAKGLLRPSLRFLADGLDPFGAQPLNLALPQLEWGMNWCFATMFNRHLLLHAGSLEIGGNGLLLIGEPGSGKSTLSAALALSGARILSDEFGIVRLADHRLLGLPKPVALKNRSIELIRAWSSRAVLGPTFHNTHKGDLAHLAIPLESVDARAIPASPKVIVFPRWRGGHRVNVVPLESAESFNLIAFNSFNFPITAEAGFDAVESLVRSCACLRMEFDDLESAVATLHDLARG